MHPTAGKALKIPSPYRLAHWAPPVNSDETLTKYGDRVARWARISTTGGPDDGLVIGPPAPPGDSISPGFSWPNGPSQRQLWTAGEVRGWEQRPPFARKREPYAEWRLSGYGCPMWGPRRYDFARGMLGLARLLVKVTPVWLIGQAPPAHGNERQPTWRRASWQDVFAMYGQIFTRQYISLGLYPGL